MSKANPSGVIYKLTPELKQLLVDIQNSDMDTYGYSELILSTITLEKYNEFDRDWLNTVRRKWINHLKKEKADSLFIKDIIETTKSW